MRARVDDCAVLLAVLCGMSRASYVAHLLDVPERTARRSLGRLTRAGVLREGRESSGGMGAPRKVWEVVS